MCKICEHIDDSYIQDETELDFGPVGKKILSLSIYREDDKSPMEISSELGDENGGVEVGFTASYCPFCGRKLS